MKIISTLAYHVRVKHLGLTLAVLRGRTEQEAIDRGQRMIEMLSLQGATIEQA